MDAAASPLSLASKEAGPSSLVESIFGNSRRKSKRSDCDVVGGEGDDDNKKRKKLIKKGKSAVDDDKLDKDGTGGGGLLTALFGGGTTKTKTKEEDDERINSARSKVRALEEKSSSDDDDDDDNASSSSEEDNEEKEEGYRNDPLDDDAATPGDISNARVPSVEEEPHDDNHNTDDDVEDRTVFVGNLPLGTTRKTLESLFRGNGVCVDPTIDRVISARIRRTPTHGVKLPPNQAGNQALVHKVSANTGLFDPTKSTSCVGYVVFAHPSTVTRALELNNMEIPDPTAMGTDGGKATTRHIRVDRVKPAHDASRSVFVGNLPHHKTDEETLRQHVMDVCSLAANNTEEDEPIEAVRVVRDADFQCRGFAYVLLRDKSLVPHVLQHLSDTKYMGRTLRVQVCGKRFKNRRGQAKPAKDDAPPSMSSSSKVRHDHPKKPRHGDSRPNSDDARPSPMGALRRIMASQASAHQSKSRRARGPTAASQKFGPRGGGSGGPNKSPAQVPKKRSASGGSMMKSGSSSKRTASIVKSQERVKKIEKRIKRGMGKNKKSASR